MPAAGDRRCRDRHGCDLGPRDPGPARWVHRSCAIHAVYKKDCYVHDTILLHFAVATRNNPTYHDPTYHNYHHLAFLPIYHMGVSINGYTQKWLIYQGKSHLQMDDDWGYPHGYGNHHIYMASMVRRPRRPLSPWSLSAPSRATRPRFVASLWQQPTHRCYTMEAEKMMINHPRCVAHGAGILAPT